MKLKLITIGDQLPAWAKSACDDYLKRLPPEFNFDLIELKAEKRGKNPDLKRLLEKEGERMLATIGPQEKVISLDERGKLWTTLELSEQLQNWRDENHSICLLIGGTDGLAPACKKRAEYSWSLSPLTLPHALARVLVLEQLYRAFTILTHHPYHRA